MDLGQLLRSLGFQLGLLFGLTSGEPVDFNNLMIIDDSLLEAQLVNSWTNDMEELLYYSIEIQIEYTVVIYTNNNRKRTYKIKKALRWINISDQYQFSINNQRTDRISKKEGISQLMKLSLPVNTDNARLLIITAEIQIPFVEDQKLAQSLWGGAVPRASIQF